MSRIREGGQIIGSYDGAMSRVRNRAKLKRYSNKVFASRLGAHFKKLRTRKGFSLDRLAREGDRLSRGSLHRLEVASGDVQVSLLYRVAQVLEIHPRDLLNFEMPDEE